MGSQFDPHVANTLVSVHSKCRWLADARKLFDNMFQTDLVKWNCMMAGLVQHGFMEEGSNLLKEMISAGVKPDGRTFATFLPSVADSMSFTLGKEIHGYILRHGISLDVFLKSALIDIYWYVLNGKANSALEVFRWFLQEKMSPNSLTMAIIFTCMCQPSGSETGRGIAWQNPEEWASIRR
ncbi:unnamed protein product [Linum tenue]|uniref:Pentatricopeptide repeat-containing protein n=1 Tax=Linum tenue TaxID=586396 RepID=A0AAV0QYM2_9ROSI|nr:unnamed protein product [Linum tenue]CAI0549389.1 unnamed protein product [Linum tenue]